jgi:two-component system, LuxR family, sensor histidine kinase DctS
MSVSLLPAHLNSAPAKQKRRSFTWLNSLHLGTVLRTRRRAVLALLLGTLVYIGLVALMLYLASQAERTRTQTELDRDAQDLAQEFRTRLSSIAPSLQQLSRQPLDNKGEISPEVTQIFDQFSEVMRIELRRPGYTELVAQENRKGTDLGSRAGRVRLEEITYLACEAANLREEPQFSGSTFIPNITTIGGFESVDLCIPITGQRERQLWIVTLSLSDLLRVNEEASQGRFVSVFLSDPDGSRLATVSRGSRSSRDLTASALVVLPGTVFSVGLRARQAPGFGLLSTFSLMAMGFSILFFLSVLLLTRDILRRQRAEAALSQALAYRKAMEDSLLTGLRARDMRGMVTYVNPAFCELVGFDAAQLVGHWPPPYWPPEAQTEYEQRLAKRVASSPSRDVFETEYRHADGRRLPVLIYEAPLVDAQGRQTGWMASVLDMSEQRRIENVARAQQDKLAEASRLTTVGELASTLSHELNQPLAAIASFAAAGRNLLDSGQAEQSDVREIMRDIGAQAERAGRVIKSVRGFVRRGEGERVAVSVNALFDEIAPLFQLQARAAKAQVFVEVEADLPQVMGDHTLLEQVLLNLSRNGFEAMVNQPAIQRHLLVSAMLDKDTQHIVVSVADTGTGIDAKTAEQLFTPFYTTKPEGMGLGLSICRNVIEQHGGSIYAEPNKTSPTGTGTVFRFTLPPHDRISRR